MARPNQEAIETFMSITGTSEVVAVQKLEDHGGDLNDAVNAHFNGGDRNIMRETSNAALPDDFMDMDDPSQIEPSKPPLSRLPPTTSVNPLSLLDPNLGSSLFDSGSEFSAHRPFVSHPREVRESPIEVKDGKEQSGQSGHGPTTDDEDIPSAPTANAARSNEQKDHGLGDSSFGVHHRPTAPGIDDLPDYNNDIEEEMIQAAIEASKRDVENAYTNQQLAAYNDLGDPGPQRRQSDLLDSELAHAVSLSLKTAAQETALRKQGEKFGASELEAYKSAKEEELGKLASQDGSSLLSGSTPHSLVIASSEKGVLRQSGLEVGSSSVQDEAEDVGEIPLVRHRRRLISSGSVESDEEIEETEINPPSSPGIQNNVDHPLQNGNGFPSDEWGGISSVEHDEAVMLEAALFGGIPEGNGYRFAYAPHQFMQNGIDRTVGSYPRRIPRTPSPSLTAQRLIREQQDDEYLASLHADREKELKAMEEAEARRLEEQAARAAALEEVWRKEEESCRKLEEEQEVERQLVAKEASLPGEPTPDDESAVTLLVRLPNGSRHGRRFLKTDKLQYLFDFIDVGRLVKPGTYRLVRPFPRRAFSDGESALTLNELGLTSKQEALFLELI